LPLKPLNIKPQGNHICSEEENISCSYDCEGKNKEEQAKTQTVENKTSEENDDVIESLCNDSDGGKNYYEKGNVVFYDVYENKTRNATDACAGKTDVRLDEYYCYNGQSYIEDYNCSYCCYNGACLSSEQCNELGLSLKPLNIKPQGNIKILVFELKPIDYYDPERRICCNDNWNPKCSVYAYDPGYDYCAEYNTISLVNRAETELPYWFPSIHFIETWYEEQARKNGIQDFNIDLEIAGPFSIDRLFYGFETDSGVVELFNQKLIENRYSRSDYDIIHYIYFDDYGKNPNSSSIGFRSFASNLLGETYNDVNDVSGLNLLILHEMAHIFGAADTYNLDSFSCKITEGIPDPTKVPLFPQTEGCLMCMHIMENETSSLSIDAMTLKDLVLCDAELKSFGWKNK